MLIDFAEMDSSSPMETDVCIVGAGPAGITLALELARSGRDVVLLESGGTEPDNDAQDLAIGELAGIPYMDLDVVRLRYLGGSTNHWGGQSTPLQESDFLKRDWVADSGWPISYGEFAGYLDRAAALCRLPAGAWSPSGSVPANPLEEGDFQSVLLRFPDPVFSFGEVHRSELEATPGLRTILGAHVLNLSSNAAGSAVLAATVGNHAGKRVEVRANTYVLAAGGIENARQLLISGPGSVPPDRWPGLGNSRDIVGRYFMEHPAYDLGQVVLTEDAPALSDPYNSLNGNDIRLDLQLTPAAQRAEQVLNHSAFLLPTGGRRPSFSDRLLEWMRGGNAEFRLRIRLEHAPYADSRVSLSDDRDVFGFRRAKLSMRMGDLELRTIQRVALAYGRALGIADLGRLRLDGSAVTDAWVADAFWQNHHAGGTRMSADPADGVVDTNCKIHEMTNLYVAGSSVFPTSGHANPTMNLLALVLRLADHLRKV